MSFFIFRYISVSFLIPYLPLLITLIKRITWLLIPQSSETSSSHQQIISVSTIEHFQLVFTRISSSPGWLSVARHALRSDDGRNKMQFQEPGNYSYPHVLDYPCWPENYETLLQPCTDSTPSKIIIMIGRKEWQNVISNIATDLNLEITLLAPHQ